MVVVVVLVGRGRGRDRSRGRGRGHDGDRGRGRTWRLMAGTTLQGLPWSSDQEREGGGTQGSTAVRTLRALPGEGGPYLFALAPRFLESRWSLIAPASARLRLSLPVVMHCCLMLRVLWLGSPLHPLDDEAADRVCCCCTLKPRARSVFRRSGPTS